jgi:hypothetical protein
MGELNPMLTKPGRSPAPLPPDLVEIPAGQLLVTLALGQTGGQTITPIGCLWIYHQVLVDAKTLGSFEVDTRQTVPKDSDGQLVKAGGLQWRGSLKPAPPTRPGDLLVQTDIIWDRIIYTHDGEGIRTGFLLTRDSTDFNNEAFCSLDGTWKCIGGFDFYSQTTHRKNYAICIRIDRSPLASSTSTTTAAKP